MLCVVTGSGGLRTDAQVALVDGLERVNCLASLSTGAASLKGAAPRDCGRHLALTSYDSDAGVLHMRLLGAGAPHNLRLWFLALRSLLETMPPDTTSAARAQCPAGTYPALAALAALNSACSATLGMARITVVCSPPPMHVDSETLCEALAGALAAAESCCSYRATYDTHAHADANSKHAGVTFALLGSAAAGGGGLEAELRASHALDALTCDLDASDNGSVVHVPLSAAGVLSFATTLFFPDQGGVGSIAGAGRPCVQATLGMPSPLVPGGPRRLRLELRPEVLPLHDACAPSKLCRCHGRALLSTTSAIGADDIAHFLSLAAKNDVCPVTAKGLLPAEWLPNAIAIGRDTSLLLPSFFTPSILAPGAPGAPALLAAIACVPLASLSQSWLFGTPWCARALDEDAPCAAGIGAGMSGSDDMAGMGLGGGGGDDEGADYDGAANGVLFAAVCASLARSDAGLLCSSASNLDAGASTPFKCFYLLMPPPAVGSGGGGAASQLLLKRVAAKEELLPSPPAAETPDVPPDVAASVSRALAALPVRAPYEPLSAERGVHKVLTALLSRSLAPPMPSRGAGGAGGAKGKRKGHIAAVTT
jgi:hypothetical protein